MGLVASSHTFLLMSKISTNLVLHRPITKFSTSVGVTDLIKANNATSTFHFPSSQR